MHALAVAPDGTLWAALNQGERIEGRGRPGIARFDGRRWRTYTVGAGYPADEVYELAVGDDGTLWATTGGGLLSFDGRSWRNHGGGRFHWGDDVLIDYGIIWTAHPGHAGRVSRLSYGRWTVYGAKDGWTPGAQYSLALAPDGTLWAGSGTIWGMRPEAGPLASFDGETWTVYDEASGFPADGVRELEVTPDGAVWMIVEGQKTICGAGKIFAQCLVRYDGSSWTAFTDGGPASGEITSLERGPDGRLWVGTWNGGLWSYSDGVWTNDRVEDSGPIAVGPDGTLWLASRRALTRFTPPE